MMLKVILVLTLALHPSRTTNTDESKKTCKVKFFQYMLPNIIPASAELGTALPQRFALSPFAFDGLPEQVSISESCS